MKLTKKLEAEILKVYSEVLDANLRGDMRTFASILDENCHIFGTAASEVFKNKKAAVKFYTATAGQVTGKVELRNRNISVMAIHNDVMVNEQADFYILIDDQWTFYNPCRVSCLFHKKNNQWKTIHMHGSFPDSKTEEGEQVNTDKIKAENIQLRVAVKRRTEELENKNRELEIETSLEKVRAVAMGMRKPENFPDVCEVLFKELQSLGFNELRNAMVNIHNDEKRSFVNYDYSDEIGKSITPLVYDEHPVIKKQIKQIRKADDAFSESVFKGKDLEDWKTFRKSRGEKNDKRIRNIKALYYYFYSIGTGSIGISTFYKITEEKKDVLKRFRNVFAFAYRRYMDVAQAEAQAKEAKVELALERVRARAMAMHKSEELLEAGALLYNELSKLGIEKLTSGYMLIDEDEKMGWNYGVNPSNGQIIPKPVGVPLTEKKEIRSIIEAWKRQEPIHVKHLDPEETILHQSYMADHAVNFPITKEKLLSITPERLVIHTFNFKQGYLIIVRGEVLSAEQQEMVVRFAKVFEMTYRRFLDLQKAESQAREAQIETGLERVRSKTMAMHKSEEVTGIAVSLNEELMKLGFEGGSTIVIIDKETGDTEQWTGFSEDKNLKSCYVPYFKHPYHDALLDDWKREEKFLVYTLTGEEKKTIDEHYFATGYKDFPESDKKWMREMGSVTFSHAFMKYGAIHWGPDHLTEEQLKILQRFSKVFEQSYTRFLDLQKAESQAREAKIEAALERTRTQSMLMQHSKELDDTLRVFHEQVLLLGINSEFSYLWLPDEDKDRHIFWAAWAENLPTSQRGKSSSKVFKSKALNYPLDRNEPATKKCLVDWKSDEPVHSYYLPPGEVENYFVNWKELLDGVERLNPKYFPGGLNYVEAFMKYGCFGIMIESELSEEEKKILYRFAIEFERTYTRFLDLQKAESQAREAQIEAALERVRSRSMAMHKSDDLHEVIKVVTEQLSVLDLKFNVANFAKIDPDGSWDLWLSTPEQAYPALIHVPYLDHPIFNDITEQVAKNNDFYTDIYAREETNIFFHHFFENTIAKSTPEERKQFVYNSKGFTRSLFLTKNIWFSVGRYDAISFSDEENTIFKRFANVFEQAYTRFLDLQKAEAQAREAQIEASLERVRSRAMAMQNSDELKELIGTVFTELTKLDIVLTRCLIMIYDPRSNDSVWWMANSEAPTEPIGLRIQNHKHPPYAAYLKAWQEKKLNWVYVLEGAVKKDWDDFLFVETELSHLPDFVIAGMKAPERVYLNSSFNSFGNLTLATLEPLSNEHFDILLRFAKVFDLTYTRFNDLKQAEAQAREARIETALERVRSRTMAMQKPDELADAAQILYREFATLNIKTFSCGYMFIDEEKHTQTAWVVLPDGTLLPSFIVFPLTGDHVLDNRYKDWKEKKPLHLYEIQGEVNKEHHKFLSNHVPPFVVKDIFSQVPDRIVFHCANFSNGYLLILATDYFSREDQQTVIRFAKVFEMTYTRFLDLRQAEAQTREAQIELALERVRARTMAMHKSEELAETAQVLFQQLSELGGIPDRIAIGIADEKNGVVNFWTTDQQGTHLDHSFSARLNERTTIAKTYQAWKEQKRSLVVDLHGEELKEWIQFAREEMRIAVKEDQIKDRRVHSLAFFSHGWILVSSHEPQSTETIQILERFASVFNLTYRRFLDLQKAEAQAKEAQIETVLERVRSRTMAMQKSDELTDVAGLLFEQVSALGIKTWTAGFNVWSEDNNSYVDYITSPQGGFIEPYTVYTDTAEALTDISNARKSGVEFDVQYVEGEKIKQLYLALTKLDEKQYEIMLQDGVRFPSHQYEHFVFGSKVSLMFITYEPVPEAHDIFKRLGKVFEQTYTRFLDLQKAEAQAREAQIEGALEKVRSHTMGMRSSEDLANVASVMFDQMRILGGDLFSFGIVLCDKHENMVEQWHSIPGAGMMAPFFVPVNLDHIHQYRYDQWKSGTELFSIVIPEDYIAHHFELMLALPSVKAVWEGIAEQGIALPAIPTWEIDYGASFRYGYLLVSALKPFEEDKIFPRFAKVFEQAYTRFLDLQKAEAQARESQIEASLERVRASAMAMHRSDELSNVLAILFEQFDVLKIQPVDVHLDLFDLEKNTFSYRATGKEGKRVIAEQIVDLDSRPEWQALLQKWKNGKPNTVDFSYYPKEVIRELMAFFPEIWAAMPEDAIMSPEDFPDGIFDALGYCKFGYIGFHHHRKATEEEQRILIRFANEFERLYQRFLDLQKAEAQAKEAQIEASLERVRSKTMAMHNSQDVGNTVATMFDQLVHLGVKTNRCGILIFSDTDHTEVWTAKSGPTGEATLIIGHLDVTIHPMLQRVHHAWTNKETFHSYELAGDDIKNYYNAINNYPDYPTRFNLDNLPSKEIHSDFFFPEGAVFSFTSEPVPEEDALIFKRFAGVFGQTYRRYLDLQKAEANAREAQIEAGLERVRARTMAMHSSEDVSIATATMFTELEKLGIENFRGGITNIIPNRTQHVWSVNNLEEGKVLKSVGTFNIDAHPFWQLMYKEWEAKKDFIHYYLAGEDKQDYFEVLNAIQDYLPQNFQQYPDLHFQVYYFNEGAVWTNSLHPHSEEDKQVMKRFTSVFSLTYRRYQDLQKAEAQAKEATIEAALERVRGKAMAMHSSKDLTTTIGVFYHELEGLNLTPRRCGIGLINKETKRAEISTMNASADGEGIELIGNLDLRTHPVLTGVYNNWLTKTEYHPVLRGNEIKEYYQIVRPQIDFPDYPNDIVQYGYFIFFDEGGVYAWTEKELSEEELKIYRRFTSVLSLTYKRYKDLKDAEARTLAAIKDAALDRIRADIASMRTINDLDRITPLIWNELTVLGIPFIRCGVFIMDEEQELIHTFLSTPDGKAIAAFHLPYDTPGNLRLVISNWKIKNKYIDHWDEKEFIQFAEILMQQGALTSAEQYLKTIPKKGFHLHFLPFLQGMLYVGNTTQLDNDEIELIQHVADAFSTAYARYEDFNKLEAAKQQVEQTLTDLKQAQTQLVQSEKMASLGEMTAGIAHEIQNPLNFVNNFSEVSKELLDEMKEELATGNPQQAIEIAADVIQNLEKINHHGKRADAIVKSMLQHSRSSSGKKEPTDINGLADEYLRLAYHGLRAKDKSFNAKFETEFDSSIGKINIISQDIGRVLVNLINNAFYAVSERKKQESNGYEPTVEVLTKKTDDKIEIKVRDNGNGIPKKVLDKIFQPFFTTKPTGQGTGLGLSLAYDIVTKGHGGELKVETKEGEGSEFIIQLPA